MKKTTFNLKTMKNTKSHSIDAHNRGRIYSRARSFAAIATIAIGAFGLTAALGDDPIYPCNSPGKAVCQNAGYTLYDAFCDPAIGPQYSVNRLRQTFLQYRNRVKLANIGDIGTTTAQTSSSDCIYWFRLQNCDGSWQSSQQADGGSFEDDIPLPVGQGGITCAGYYHGT